MSKATDDVLAERQRQIDAEGWTTEHDDQHSDCSMALAAASYATHYFRYSRYLDEPMMCDKLFYRTRLADGWPWAEIWWKPSTPRRDLVKAAALLLAEIERIDRKACK